MASSRGTGRRRALGIAPAVAALLGAPGLARGHPMGNFAISHYAGLRVERDAIHVRYLIDLAEILKVRPRGPYVLGGYSVGGLMAFEVALMMQKRGLEVARVISFDTHAPGYPRKLPLPVRMDSARASFSESAAGVSVSTRAVTTDMKIVNSRTAASS